MITKLESKEISKYDKKQALKKLEQKNKSKEIKK